MCANDWGSQKQGGHKTRPYEKRGFVGASDPARKVHELGQDNFMVALARTSTGTDGDLT